MLGSFPALFIPYTFVAYLLYTVGCPLHLLPHRAPPSSPRPAGNHWFVLYVCEPVFLVLYAFICFTL